ncbi:UNVERIFIED_CONTAM: hypothetical protein RMT77_005824 [Armadillidium vulgare]
MEREETSDLQTNYSDLEGAVGFQFNSFNNAANYLDTNPPFSHSSSSPTPGSSGCNVNMKAVKKKQPHCSLCSNHGFEVSKKGHKFICPYDECQCEKCQITKMHQKYMRKQKQVKRKQDIVLPAVYPEGNKHSFKSDPSSLEGTLTADFPQTLQHELERDLTELGSDSVIEEVNFLCNNLLRKV